MSGEARPPTQVFDTEPSDEALATFLDPEGRAFMLGVDENDEMLVCRPAGVPIWVIVVCLLPPYGALIFIWLYRWNQQELGLFDAVAAFIAPLASIGLVGILSLLTRHMLSRGAYFVLDKSRNVLILPRLGITINASEIAAFVLFTGWYTVRDRYGSESVRTHEFSVVTHRSPTQLTRYPLVISDHGRRVRRLAQNLADAFRIELRILKSGLFR